MLTLGETVTRTVDDAMALTRVSLSERPHLLQVRVVASGYPRTLLAHTRRDQLLGNMHQWISNA